MKNVIAQLLAVIILNVFYADVKANDFVKDQAPTRKPRAVKSEYIGFKSAKINGKIPFLTKTNLLFNLIGKPDQLSKPDLNEYCGSFYNKVFKLASVKGVDAEIYGDTAVVRSINFKKSPDFSLATRLINLNHNTTLADLKKVFPNAVKSSVLLNDVDMGKTVAVHIAIEKELEDSWLLLFQNGKLVRIDYYRPC